MCTIRTAAEDCNPRFGARARNQGASLNSARPLMSSRCRVDLSTIQASQTGPNGPLSASSVALPPLSLRVPVNQPTTSCVGLALAFHHVNAMPCPGWPAGARCRSTRAYQAPSATDRGKTIWRAVWWTAGEAWLRGHISEVVGARLASTGAGSGRP